MSFPPGLWIDKWSLSTFYILNRGNSACVKRIVGNVWGISVLFPSHIQLSDMFGGEKLD